MKDKIVESVIQQFQQRSEVGIKKYGTTLEDNNTDDFLQHAIEEAMDFILYLTKIKFILGEKGLGKLQDIESNYNPIGKSDYKKYNDLFNQKDRRRI